MRTIPGAVAITAAPNLLGRSIPAWRRPTPVIGSARQPNREEIESRSSRTFFARGAALRIRNGAFCADSSQPSILRRNSSLEPEGRLETRVEPALDTAA